MEEKRKWILVPMRCDKSKKAFENFIHQRTGNFLFRVGTQYKDGTVLLMVSTDLKHFKHINYTCAASADFFSDGVKDFIEHYDDFKKRYDAVIDKDGRFPRNFFREGGKVQVAHLTIGMPDGTLLGLPIFDGENMREKVADFQKHWKEVTSKNPELYEHNVIKDRKCPKCGGELHSKGHRIWCVCCDYNNL